MITWDNLKRCLNRGNWEQQLCSTDKHRHSPGLLRPKIELISVSCILLSLTFRTGANQFGAAIYLFSQEAYHHHAAQEYRFHPAGSSSFSWLISSLPTNLSASWHLMTVIGISSYFYCNIKLCSQIPSLISWLLTWHYGRLTSLKSRNMH